MRPSRTRCRTAAKQTNAPAAAAGAIARYPESAALSAFAPLADGPIFSPRSAS
jgi:hypothetical protein